jgi:hypothetical protein
MKMSLARRFLFSAAFLAALFIAAAPPAFSQSCALCYTQAASSGARMIDALKSGILILIIPPTLASVALIGVCYRKRNQYRREEFASEMERSW